ncbi:isoprenylcysteine carboxylmethyltransferase family protein [Herbiconiux sp.]|uniref:methyltransferase family protein n=1 Tax=Herbiconiux sp. TaxID=1871186 RepID=UPI0025C084B5|nr:isoprenylcysteine carboxylmethyltransferase family protein [Herbiconiux sp.]
MTRTAPGAASAARWGRLYFALQALGGAAWWVGVFTVPAVRAATLGGLEPVPVAAADLPLFVGASALAALGVRWAAAVATVWTLLVAAALALYATVTGEAGWGVLIMAGAAGGSLVALTLVLLGRVPTEWAVRGPFAFRLNGTGRTRGSDVLRTFAQIAVFWGLGLVVVPIVIRMLEQRWAVGLAFPPAALPVGIVLLVLASALGIGSAVVMSTLGEGTPLPSAMPHRLVIAGPYRWVRNPMAVAGIVQGAAIGLILSSWLVVAYAVAGALVWNLVIRPHEEADLARRFGADFARYRAEVRCWLPRLRPVRATPRR